METRSGRSKGRVYGDLTWSIQHCNIWYGKKILPCFEELKLRFSSGTNAYMAILQFIWFLQWTFFFLSLRLPSSLFSVLLVVVDQASSLSQSDEVITLHSMEGTTHRTVMSFYILRFTELSQYVLGEHFSKLDTHLICLRKDKTRKGSQSNHWHLP